MVNKPTNCEPRLCDSVRLARRRIIAALSAAVLIPTNVQIAGSRRKVLYNVPLIPQETRMSCWAAAIAMIVSWAEKKILTPFEVAEKTGRLDQYRRGLESLDSEVFERWGMTTEAPQTFTAQGFMDLLEAYGPIWVAAEVRGAHIRVASGFEYGSDPYAGIVHINDPWEQDMTIFRINNKGSQYTESYIEFVKKNETLGSEELKIKDRGKHYPVYFAHLRRKPAIRKD
jgi:hypothetical protein